MAKQITLTITKNASGTEPYSYKIERSSDNGANYTTIEAAATATGGNLTYVDDGQNDSGAGNGLPDGTYKYKATGIASDGTTASANVVTTTETLVVNESIVAAPIVFGTITGITVVGEEYQDTTGSDYAGHGVTTTAQTGTGDFDIEFLIDDDTKIKGSMIGLSLHGVNSIYNDATNPYKYGSFVTSSTSLIQKISSGVNTGTDTSYTATYQAGDTLHLKRESGIIKIYINSTLLHSFPTTDNDNFYIHISPFTNNYVINPRITK